MAYQKPQIIAKSAAKQSFVAGCPAKNTNAASCNKGKDGCEYRSCLIITAR